MRLAAAGGAVCVALLWLATGAGARPAAQARSTVVFGMLPDVEGFNTALSCCATLTAALMASVELHGAFIQNNHGIWTKELVSAAKADARGVTYTIRRDAFWYWGGRKVRVTYRDFVYTLRQLDDPANAIGSREGYANLDPKRLIHHGDRRVTFFWRTTGCTADYPCGPFADWQSLFSEIYPSFALTGEDFNKIWTNCICGYDGKPVSDGPYYLARYSPGQIVVLKPNPYYHERPKIAEVDLKLLSADPGVLAEAMLSGQVDAISPSFAPDLLALRHVHGLTYASAPIYALEHLDFREGSARGAPTVTKGASNVLLRSPWMRQAIALALDRQAMIDAVYGPGSGLKPDNDLLYYPGEAGYRPDFARWNHDPVRALAILRRHCTGGPSAPDPATTKVWRCAGLPAVFRYAWPAAAPARAQIEQAAKANLKAVGIALVERPLGGQIVFSPAGIPSGDFDLAQYADFTSGDPGDWSEAYRCYGGANYTGYCRHAVDRLLQAASNEFDQTRRRALLRRAAAILAQDVPAIPLFQKPSALIYKSGLRGIGPNPGLFGPFWNIQDWRWRS